MIIDLKQTEEQEADDKLRERLTIDTRFTTRRSI